MKSKFVLRICPNCKVNVGDETLPKWIFKKSGSPRFFYEASTFQRISMYENRNKKSPRSFKTNFIYDQTIPQYDFYLETVEQTISQNVLKGKSSNILLFGNSQSGKRYTLEGPPNMPGLIFCSFESLISHINPNDGEQIFFKAFEIENEVVYDALISDEQENNASLNFRNDRERGFIVEGLKKIEIKNSKESMDVLKAIEHLFGKKNVQIVFTMEVVTNRTKIKGKRITELSFICLETPKDMRGNVTQNINWVTSLKSCLREINSQTPVVHFRKSKVTTLLKDSIINIRPTLIICTISPYFESFREVIWNLSLSETMFNVMTKYVKTKGDKGRKPKRNMKKRNVRKRKSLKKAGQKVVNSKPSKIVVRKSKEFNSVKPQKRKPVENKREEVENFEEAVEVIVPKKVYLEDDTGSDISMVDEVIYERSPPTTSGIKKSKSMSGLKSKKFKKVINIKTPNVSVHREKQSSEGNSVAEKTPLNIHPFRQNEATPVVKRETSSPFYRSYDSEKKYRDLGNSDSARKRIFDANRGINLGDSYGNDLSMDKKLLYKQLEQQAQQQKILMEMHKNQVEFEKKFLKSTKPKKRAKPRSFSFSERKRKYTPKSSRRRSMYQRERDEEMYTRIMEDRIKKIISDSREIERQKEGVNKKLKTAQKRISNLKKELIQTHKNYRDKFEEFGIKYNELKVENENMKKKNKKNLRVIDLKNRTLKEKDEIILNLSNVRKNSVTLKDNEIIVPQDKFRKYEDSVQNYVREIEGKNQKIQELEEKISIANEELGLTRGELIRSKNEGENLENVSFDEKFLVVKNNILKRALADALRKLSVYTIKERDSV